MIIFPPPWEYFHRGDNIPTAVILFPPRWKYFYRGRNISTAVRIFPPQWEYFHRFENIPTAVKIFSPRSKYFHRGENISTAVRIFPPRWKHFHGKSCDHNSVDAQFWRPCSTIWDPFSGYHGSKQVRALTAVYMFSNSDYSAVPWSTDNKLMIITCCWKESIFRHAANI